VAIAWHFIGPGVRMLAAIDLAGAMRDRFVVINDLRINERRRAWPTLPPPSVR
jgi:hypothetical protein